MLALSAFLWHIATRRNKEETEGEEEKRDIDDKPPSRRQFPCRVGSGSLQAMAPTSWSKSEQHHLSEATLQHNTSSMSKGGDLLQGLVCGTAGSCKVRDYDTQELVCVAIKESEDEEYGHKELACEAMKASRSGEDDMQELVSEVIKGSETVENETQEFVHEVNKGSETMEDDMLEFVCEGSEDPTQRLPSPQTCELSQHATSDDTLLGQSSTTVNDQRHNLRVMTVDKFLSLAQSTIDSDSSCQRMGKAESNVTAEHCSSRNFIGWNSQGIFEMMEEDSLSVNQSKVDWEGAEDGDEGRRRGSHGTAPVFKPPVYVQRYTLVKRVLEERGIKSVVDFGSAECKIFNWLKEVKSVTRIFLVDIDGALLTTRRDVIKPIAFDHILPRCAPLTATLLHGSAGDLDSRVVGCQAATLVEIIEHLEPSMLEQVTACVFGRLRPLLIIVTTPNSDFNVLFPGLSGFRHWDHKFEWTRAEFRQWCDLVCSQHGYSVSFTGVGDPLPEMSHVGFCSQAAIFTEVAGKLGEETGSPVYNVIQEVVYPFDARTSSQRLADEVDFFVNSCYLRDEYHCHDSSHAVIPLDVIASSVLSQRKGQQWEREDVIACLQSKYSLTQDGGGVQVPLCDSASDDDDPADEDLDVDEIHDGGGDEAVVSEEDWE